MATWSNGITSALGSAWHVGHKAFLALFPTTDGTVEANKPLVVDANKKLDTLDITTLKIGGTAVTATAAEINAIAGAGLSAAELGVLDGVTAGTAAASKAVVADSSVNVAGLNVVGLARIDLDSETKTLTANAVTMTTGKFAAVITTESLTTAHTASQALVITCAGVAAGDLAFVTRAGGSNTTGVPNVTSVVCTTNTVTINLKNEALATNAFNGTFIFNLMVCKA